MPEAGILKFHITNDQVLSVDTIGIAAPANGITPSVQSIVVRQNGTVWAGLASGHLISIDSDGTGIRWIADGTGESGHSIETLHEAPDGIL